MEGLIVGRLSHRQDEKQIAVGKILYFLVGEYDLFGLF